MFISGDLAAIKDQDGHLNIYEDYKHIVLYWGILHVTTWSKMTEGCGYSDTCTDAVVWTR